MNNDESLLQSNSKKFFAKEMSKNKILRDTLISFEEILNIRKNIRIIYNVDEPEKIKSLIGQTINKHTVIDKDYEYVLLIDNTYKKLYNECKSLLGNIKS